MPYVQTSNLEFHVWVFKKGLRYSFSRNEKPPTGKTPKPMKYLGYIVARDHENKTIKLNTGRILNVQPIKRKN